MDIANIKQFIKQAYISKGYRIVGSQRNVLTMEAPATGGARYQFNKRTGTADFSRSKPEVIDIITEPRGLVIRIDTFVSGTSNVIHKAVFSTDELSKLIENKDYALFIKRLEGLALAPRN